MKHTLYIALMLLMGLVACTGNVKVYRLSGTTSNANDTIYLYGLDRRYAQMDTIVTDEQGFFEHEIATDTLFPANLLMPSSKPILLYIEPDAIAAIAQEGDGYTVTSSSAMQAVYDSMRTVLSNKTAHEIAKEIESFVTRDPLNEIGIALWRQYIIECKEPQRRDIFNILNKFGGRLMDNDYIIDFKEEHEESRSRNNVLYTALPAFKFSAKGNREVTNATYKEKFLIINFWASWDSLSVEHLKKVTALDSLYKDDELAFLNISLDYDTAAWRGAIDADSIPGDHVCDTKAWNNPLIKRYNVSRIPYSAIVNPQLLNISYNPAITELPNKIDSLVKAHKENEKEKERKRNKKRK